MGPPEFGSRAATRGGDRWTVWPIRKKSNDDGAVAGPPGPECDATGLLAARSPATSLAAPRCYGRGTAIIAEAERAVFELVGARCAPDLTWLRAGADLDRPGRGATLLIISDSPLLRRVLHIVDLDGDLPLRGSARAAQEEVDRNGHR
jgi:hypothetical protein